MNLENYNKLLEKGITPNEHYVILCLESMVEIQDKFLPDYDNLRERGLVDVDGNINIDLGSKKGDPLTAFTNKYRELWPKMMLPSGVYARASMTELRTQLTKFLKTYKYDQETILKATSVYLEEKEADGFEYTKNSYYFISKKGEPSLLAMYCEKVLNEQDSTKSTLLGGQFI